MNAGSLCTLISTKGYSLQAAAPGLAQKERKSSRYLILSLSVQVWYVCPSPILCGCVCALMRHKHTHSQPGVPQESLGGQQGLSVTVVHCLTGMDVEGFFQSCPPSLERVSPSLVPSCLMRWDPLLADSGQRRARGKNGMLT